MRRLLFVLLALSACRNKDLLNESTPDDSAPPDDSVEVPDNDGDGVPADEDCDDNDASVHPGAEEDCDPVDRDCDGDPTAGATDMGTFYTDADHDGYGAGEGISSCETPPDTSTASGDCDDQDPAYHPGAEEADCADPNDYNCDGSTGYADNDADGYAACQECDDGDAGVHPGAAEVCDGVDQNCDGVADEGVTTTYYQDLDGDTYGDPNFTTEACALPEGYSANADDCDDNAPAIHPAATEICDSLDNDCDTLVDDLDPSLDASTGGTWYSDGDNDGYGDPGAPRAACAQPSGTVTDAQDCDDGDAAVNPAATEVCDGVDNDCDGATDGPDAADAGVYYTDADSDGYGDANAPINACAQPSGAVSDLSDCDDGDGAIHPAATEVCDGADNNCDGSTDGPDAWWDSAWSYRLPLTLGAASMDVDGPPVATEIDFRTALDSLGDSGAFDPNSVRVVVQDCALGQPELPSQWEDGVAGLFEKADHSDALGDERGDLYFMWDEDGDPTSLETLAAGATAQVAVYFGTSGSDPGYTSGIVASATSLSGGPSTASFAASAGGLLSDFTLGGSASLISQTLSCCGNGSFAGSTWSNTPMYTSGTLALDLDGPVVALVEATGNVGGYDFTYWYWLFDGRPELYAKTHHVTTGSVTLNHAGHFTSGIRPWESQQPGVGAGTFTIDSGGLYADASNGSYGVGFGWIQAPLYLVGTFSLYNPYLITYGNDYADASASSPVTVGAGTVLIDHNVMMVLPHTGDFASAEPALVGLLEGVTVSASAAEAR